MPQLITITSEAIQAQIRRLLPSQQGFGIDMEASSVITPIIDITAAAEGSQLPSYLQQAYSFDSVTNITVRETTTDYTPGTGFWRINVTSTLRASSAATRNNVLGVNDGSTDKNVWVHSTQDGGINGEYITQVFDQVVYLNTGEFLRITADTGSNIIGSIRQIADLYGNLINPAGFTFE